MKTEAYRLKMGEQKDGMALDPEGIVALLCQPDGRPEEEDKPDFSGHTTGCHLWKLLLCGLRFVPFLSISLFPAPSPAPYIFFSFFNKTHFQLVQLSFLALRDY